MESEDRIRLLVERYNHPKRLRIPHTAELLRGTAVEKGWELLVARGSLPRDFVADKRRAYAESIEGKAIHLSDRPPMFPHPPSVRALLTITSDVEGILTAEKHARELAKRLTPWKGVSNDTVVWYFLDRPLDYVPYLGPSYDFARDTVNVTLEEHSINTDHLEPSQEQVPLPLLVRRGIAAWKGWETAVRLNLEISGPRWPFDHGGSRRFSELENPFEPILDLWCTGYLIYSSCEESDPTIRLYAQKTDWREA